MSDEEKSKLARNISTNMVEYISHYIDVVRKVELDHSSVALEIRATYKNELENYIHNEIYTMVNRCVTTNSSNDLLVKELCKYITSR